MNEFGIYRRTKTNCSHLFRHVDFGHLLRHLLFFIFLRTNIAKIWRKLYSQMLPKSSYRLTQIESSLFSVYLYLPQNVCFLSNFFINKIWQFSDPVILFSSTNIPRKIEHSQFSHGHGCGIQGMLFHVYHGISNILQCV